MSLAVFSVQSDGRVSAITQGMRLGANLRSGDLLSAFVVGAARLVIASGEPMLRVFNIGIEEGENYVRSVQHRGVKCVTARYRCCLSQNTTTQWASRCNASQNTPLTFGLIPCAQGSPKEVIHSAAFNPRTCVIAAVTGAARPFARRYYSLPRR